MLNQCHNIPCNGRRAPRSWLALQHRRQAPARERPISAAVRGKEPCAGSTDTADSTGWSGQHTVTHLPLRTPATAVAQARVYSTRITSGSRLSETRRTLHRDRQSTSGRPLAT